MDRNERVSVSAPPNDGAQAKLYGLRSRPGHYDIHTAFGKKIAQLQSNREDRVAFVERGRTGSPCGRVTGVDRNCQPAKWRVRIGDPRRPPYSECQGSVLP